MEKKIALLTCWYGSYPWYFPLFIHSCGYNPTVDFILITDNKEPIPSKPNNVIVIDKTIANIKEIASARLGFTVNIDYPYKLCDFKPAYGYIFPEIVARYDFWGMADIDIVYGNIRGFMTDEIISAYDIINSRHDYITGSFCLFRNCEKVNSLFMQSKDYKKVFSSPIHYCFDECNFLFDYLKQGASIFDFPDNIQSMTYVVKKAELDGKIKAFFDYIVVEGNPGKIRWENGKIIFKEEYEALLYHLVVFKRGCKPRKKVIPVPNVFHFTPKTVIYT
jgi:hypothetical protein